MLLIFVLIFVGKRIRQTLKTLYISRLFRFVLIILYSHSCGSFLLNNGYSLKEIQSWLGHSNITTTANIYAHLDTSRKQNMADKVQVLFPI
ncbi:MAG: tyrosine-type recombinase/integrase [Lachnospiraceae bacterium]